MQRNAYNFRKHFLVFCTGLDMTPDLLRHFKDGPGRFKTYYGGLRYQHYEINLVDEVSA